MEIKTKFNLNQKVSIIALGYDNKCIPCSTCDGKGGIYVKKKDFFSCSSCLGSGHHYKSVKNKWSITVTSIIGKISVDIYSKEALEDNYSSNKNRIVYMLDSTGVGSGSFYYEEHIFKTIKEAKKECDLRNSKII